MTSTGFDLDALGWDDEWREVASAYPGLGMPGRVSRVDRGVTQVITAEGLVRTTLGGAVLDAIAMSPMDAPCTGDWVLVRRWPDGPLTIDMVLPRRTVIVRADVSGVSTGQALAANHEFAGIVVALHPEPRLARLERLLALSWDSGAQPIVILTKSDLVNDAVEIAADVADVAPGVEIVCASTIDGRGLSALNDLLGASRTMALIGASGHGKSSLVNALHGTSVVATKEIRADGKGRHTSVRRELVLLPAGGALIDTPGMRGIGLQSAGAGVSDTFPDVVALAGHCRFADCGHNGEPGCAVLAAMERGELSQRRFESWRALVREERWMATRSDARLRAEQRRKWKVLTRSQRALDRNGR